MEKGWFAHDDGDGQGTAVVLMWIKLILLAICLLVLNTPGCAHTPQNLSPGASTPIAGSVDWLEGSWECVKGAERTQEHWLPRVGNTMFGINHTSVDGKLTFFEFLRIEWNGDTIIYVAQPKGGPPTHFTLAETHDDRFVFTNPEHDFPTRIVLIRHNDSYIARIEGVLDARPVADEWTFYPLVSAASPLNPRK